MKITGFISAKLHDEKTQSLILIWMVFLFPAIALLNFFTGIQNSLLSYSYRSSCLLLAFFLIARQILSVFKLISSDRLNLLTFFLKKETIAFMMLMAFWIFYLLRIYTDVSCYGIYVSGNPSLNYYLLFTIGVTLMPSLAAPTFQIRGFSFFLHSLYRLLQALCLILFILHFVIVFTSDKPVFRYILAWNEFEYFDAISISVTAGLLILISAFQKPVNYFSALWICAGAFLMSAAASRGPFLSLAVALGFSFFRRKESAKNILLILVSVLAGILFHLAFTTAFKEIFIHGNPLAERWLNFEKDQSSINRILLITEGWKQFIQQPLLGSHFVVLSLGLYVHNLILDVLLSAGITGWLLLAFPFYLFFKKFFSKECALPVLSLALFFLMNTMTSGAVYNLNEFWFLFMYVTFGNINPEEPQH